MPIVVFFFLLAAAQQPPPPPPAAEGFQIRIERRVDGAEQNPPQTPQPPIAPVAPGAEAPKSILRGHVYAQDTGAPLKRAQLTLRMDRRPGDPLMTITTAHGEFEFKNVEAGSYTLACSRSGFVPATYGQRGPGQPAVPLTVRAGQELKDLDFRLIRGGVISGTVMDEEGEPLSNVQVQVLARQYVRGQSRIAPRGGASTDDRGQYRAFNLPPGRYYVQAAMRNFGGQESHYVPVFYPNVLTLQDAQRVEITRGAEVQRVDFRMRQVPTFSVSGKVIDQATGQPLAEAAVNVMRADVQIDSFNFRGTRPDGTFRLTGLLPGRYRLMVMSGGRGPGGPMNARSVTKTFDLGDANIENMLVTVGPGITVRGKLVAHGGTIAAESLRLSLAAKGEGVGFGPMMGGGRATVNPDLTFEIPNVQPGEYTLNITASASPATIAARAGASTQPQAPFYVSEVRVGSENVLDRGISVPEGGAIGDVEAVLSFDGGGVSGRVVNEQGEPVSGVNVALVSADREKRASDRYFRSGAADQNGQYTIRGIIPGEYHLVLWPESEAMRVLEPDLFLQLEKHAVSVTVEKSATASKDLKLTSDVRTIAQNSAQ